MTEHYDIAVIGAGVFGAWTAWHLARAGRRVILLDQYGPANVRASSGGESRVIRMAYGADAIYTRMSQRSLQWWRQVFDEVGRPELFQRTGVLWMALRGNRAAEQSLDALAGAQVEHEVLDADALRQRYPQIVVPDEGWAILEPHSGGLLARRAVQAVVADACARFGVHFSRAAVGPPQPGAGTDSIAIGVDARIYADVQIWACGPWLGQVFPKLLGQRIFTTRQEVFYVGVDPGDGRFAPPQMPTWMDFERDWYGLPDLEGRGFKLACDVHGPAFDPDRTERRASEQGIVAARAFLARRFPALAHAPLIGSEVCQYESTSNGDFLIDRHPDFDNVWLVGGGSGHGFKHGPAVGEYVSQRLCGEIPAEPRFSLVTKATRQARQVH